MMQTTNVGLTSNGASAGMMNEGRHHHAQPGPQNQPNPGGNFKNCSNTSQQHCCCFGAGGKDTIQTFRFIKDQT